MRLYAGLGRLFRVCGSGRRGELYCQRHGIVEKVEQKVLGNLSQLIGIYLLQQQNILAMGNSAQMESYMKGNGEIQTLYSGDGILQKGEGDATEEPEENEFLDFSFGG